MFDISNLIHIEVFDISNLIHMVFLKRVIVFALRLAEIYSRAYHVASPRTTGQILQSDIDPRLNATLAPFGQCIVKWLCLKIGPAKFSGLSLFIIIFRIQRVLLDHFLVWLIFRHTMTQPSIDVQVFQSNCQRPPLEVLWRR